MLGHNRSLSEGGKENCGVEGWAFGLNIGGLGSAIFDSQGDGNAG